MPKIKAEYIWLDGTKPTAQLRSKTRIVKSSLSMKMKPRTRAWIHTFYRLQIPVVFIFPLNFIINSNYMYLKAKPIVENPLVIGEWPYYILLLELITLVHIYIIHLIVFKRSRYGY